MTLLFTFVSRMFGRELDDLDKTMIKMILFALFVLAGAIIWNIFQVNPNFYSPTGVI